MKAMTCVQPYLSNSIPEYLLTAHYALWRVGQQQSPSTSACHWQASEAV